MLDRLGDLEREPTLEMINLFIKPEPHKPKKVKAKAWRLISGMSVVDNLVAQVLFGELLEIVESRPGVYHTMLGWAPFQEGALPFADICMGGKALELADKSSWDWTVQPYMFKILEGLLVWLLEGDPVRELQIRNHIIAVGGKKCMQARGRDYVSPDGIMPSGWKLTILANSMLQVIVHACACVRSNSPWGFFMAMGDDTAQSPTTDLYKASLSSLGPIVKECCSVSKSEPFEFVGFHLSKTEYHPSYTEKHAFAVNNIAPENLEATLTAYQLLYLFDPKRLQAIQRWAKEAGFGSSIISVTNWKNRVNGLPIIDLF